MAPNKPGVMATFGVGALLVLCCAAPALIAAGALGGLGIWLRNPWVIGAAAIAAAIVVAWRAWIRHRRHFTGPSDHSSHHEHSDNERPSSM